MATTLNLRGTIMAFDQPKIMGILNVTKDSFYDGGRYSDVAAALLQVDKMVLEGVDIIDIGGQSTRPGAQQLAADEELSQILPVFMAIRTRYPALAVSIDTFYASVADKLLSCGADLINDVSGGDQDPSIIEVVASYQCPYILMHHQGTPADMQLNPRYHNLLTDVFDYFVRKISFLHEMKIYDVVVDPGFGFGKTLEDNYQLLRHLSVFKQFNALVLAGISRKSMIYKLLEISPDTALSATSALHMVALQNGANILRAHDVQEAVQVRRLFEQLRKV